MNQNHKNNTNKKLENKKGLNAILNYTNNGKSRQLKKIQWFYSRL